MNKKPIPTEPYPRLLWYQEKRKPCTPEEILILYNRYKEVSIGRIKQKFPTANMDEVIKLAEKQAESMLETEINTPTVLKKILVNTYAEHMATKDMIESSEVFLKWYKE